MCRNIKPLFNYKPAATDAEIEDAALQYVRKVSGFRKPSQANKEVFNSSVNEIANITQELLNKLETNAPKRNRTTKIEKSRMRFNNSKTENPNLHLQKIS